MAFGPDSSRRTAPTREATELACIRLLDLHERMEEEHDLLEDMDCRLDVALRQHDLAAIEALEDEALRVKSRVDELIAPFTFAASEYHLLAAPALEVPHF